MMPAQFTQIHLGRILLALYFISGITSLAYEVLWIRMLSLQFGVSIFGVIVTVSAFMAGLGAGSLFGQRFLTKYDNPVIVFAALEAIVACIALTMPLLLLRMESLIAEFGIGSGLVLWYTIEFFLVGVLLFIPALLLGSGFPVILLAIKATHLHVSHIYGINAIGAAFGALIPLVLLPVIG